MKNQAFPFVCTIFKTPTCRLSCIQLIHFSYIPLPAVVPLPIPAVVPLPIPAVVPAGMAVVTEPGGLLGLPGPVPVPASNIIQN